MVPQHHPFPGLANIDGELLGGELRSPEEICVVHEDYCDKASRCAQCGRVAEIGPERFSQPNPLLSVILPLISIAFPVFQRPDEYDAEQASGRTECYEYAAPGVEKPKHPCDHQSRHHQSDIQCRLMDGKSKGARLFVMHRYECVGAWRIEALADTCSDRAEEKSSPESADEAHAYGHERPCDQRKRYKPLAGTAVSHEAGDDRHRRQRPGKRRIDPSDLNVGKSDILLDRNSQKTEKRPIRLMEEECATQHRYQQPFVACIHTRPHFLHLSLSRHALT